MKTLSGIKMLLLAALPFTLFSQTPLDSALIACYPFSGNANDANGNGNNGTVNGAALSTDRFGNPNSAYSFNGSNQNILVSNFNTKLSSTEHSISFWATSNLYATRSAFLMVPDDPSNRYNIHIYYGNMLSNSQTFWDFGSIFSNGRLYIATGPLPPANNWDHWVFVSSATGSFLRCYKNGVLQLNQSGNSTFNVSQTKDLLIGGGVGTNSSFLWFDGKLDDIRIYRRALTQNDVNTLYTMTASCQFCELANTPAITTPSASLSVCIGKTTTLSATGQGTISWYSTSTTTVPLINGNNYVPPVFTAPGNYTFYATASNSCSTSAKIPVVVSTKSCAATGMEEDKHLNDTSVYPNPNTGEFNISLSNLNEQCKLRIYNPLGQLVYEAGLKNKVLSVNLKHLAKGIYVVKLFENEVLIKQDKVLIE